MTTEAAMDVLKSRGLETKAKALAIRVQIDVDKWGEAERQASHRMHAKGGHGLIVNSIAVMDSSHPDRELMAAAKAIFSRDDWRAIQQGG